MFFSYSCNKLLVHEKYMREKRDDDSGIIHCFRENAANGINWARMNATRGLGRGGEDDANVAEQ